MTHTIKHEPSCGEGEGSTHWGCPCQIKLVRDLEAQVEDMKNALDSIGYARLVDDGAPPSEEIREARNIARVTLARYTK